MSLRKNNISTVDDFADFLREKFGFVNLKLLSVDSSLRPGTNVFYSAETQKGKKIFIKASADAHLVKSEYWANRHLHALDPEHFVEAIAYHERRPFAFCATAFEPGTPLLTYIENHELTEAEKINILEKVYAIFCTLRKGDVVHRDLHLNQMIYNDGNVKLIDFQYAVSKSDYREVAYANFYILAERNFKYKRYVWDDTNDIILLFETLDCPESFAARYEEMLNDMHSHVGKDSIHYKLPSVLSVRLYLAWLIFKRALYRGGKRKSYDRRVRQCRKFLTELIEMKR